MSYGYPGAPDWNPPPGIPKGYPYGPRPVPSSNPMLPSHTPTNPYASPYPPSSSPYPSATQTYPSSSPYPPATQSYPSSSPYPSATQTYPSSSPYPPATQSYPSSSPYPSATQSYPSSSPYPPATRSYPSSSPYPPATQSYPSSSPYPSATQSYPSSSPYPSATQSYPSSSPYPSATQSHQPSASPYPSANQSRHPSASPYPASGYPSSLQGTHTGGVHHPSGREGYNMSGSSVFPPTPHRRHVSNMAQYCYSEGTVKDFPGFDPQQDAQALRKAMKGLGTDEKAIIDILAKRSNSQRVYIGVAFKQLFGKDLIDDLKSELSGNFEDVIVALMTPTNDYLASEVRKAISGIGTDEDVLIEVLCTRTNQEIWCINESYMRLYGKNMEDDIKSDTSGHFERLMVSTCTGARSEAPADEERAKMTAGALFAAGVGQWGTDESTFNSILVAESFAQLALTFYEYQKLAGHTVAEAIDKEMSGDLKKGMLAIARTVENRPFYFAEKLYKAMKVGLGTDDRTLIRIIVSRCEVDMVQIKAEYERNYGKPLADAIHGDTSGDYRRVLIALVNGY